MESDKYVENLLKMIEREKKGDLDPFLREGSIVLLGISMNPKAIEPLVGLLKEEDSEIRNDVAESLGEYGEQAVPHLVQALKDEDWKVQWGAADALSCIGEPAQTLLITLLHDEDWKIQWGAAEALRRMTAPLSTTSIPSEWKKVVTGQSGALLVQHLDDEDWEIRWRALVTLGELKDTRAVTPLIDALHHQDNNIRERAAGTLGKIADRRAVEPLINALQDTYKYVRIQAAHSLGKIRDERAIIPLIRKFDDEVKYPLYVSQAASFALSRIGKPAIGPLIEVLKTDGASLSAHYQASEALRRIGSPAAKQLIDAMKDGSWKRGWGAIALGKTGDKRAVEPLITALKDKDREIRGRAAIVLEMLEDPRAVYPLIEALEDKDDFVAGHAAMALRDMGPSARTPLVEAFKRAKGKVRSSVVWDLGAVGDASVVDLLIEALQDDYWEVRKYAIRSLGEIVKREKEKVQEGTSPEREPKDVKEMEKLVVESVAQALKDRHKDIRCQAVRTLGRIGNEKAIELLEGALKDRNKEVRYAADRALTWINERKELQKSERNVR